MGTIRDAIGGGGTIISSPVVPSGWMGWVDGIGPGCGSTYSDCHGGTRGRDRELWMMMVVVVVGIACAKPSGVDNASQKTKWSPDPSGGV